jgi:hypothetical protein
MSDRRSTRAEDGTIGGGTAQNGSMASLRSASLHASYELSVPNISQVAVTPPLDRCIAMPAFEACFAIPL